MTQSYQKSIQEIDPIIVQKFTLPMIVPDIGETERQWRARWRRFYALPEKVKSIMADERTMRIIQRIGERAGFSLEEMAVLARAIRLYYFGELPLEKFADYFIENLGIAPLKAQDIARILTEQIIKKPARETKVRMTLRETLERFKSVKNQIITKSNIMVAGTQKYSPGTIGNWITDYRLSVGQGKHTAIERGNYLFHGRNTRSLSAEERQRVAMVLKSIDENMPLVVDIEREEVVFPVAQKVPRRTGVKNTQPSTFSQREGRHSEQRNAHGDMRTADNNSKQIQGMHSNQHQHTRTMQKDAILKKKNENAHEAVEDKGQPMGYVTFSSGQKLAQEKESAQMRANNSASVGYK